MRFVRSLMPVLAGALLWTVQVGAQEPTGTVSGRVLDATSERPLSGAEVVVEGTQLTAVAGADGQYVLSGVPAGTHQVRASLIGYGGATQEVVVASGETVTAEFALEPQAIVLDELVATGYGQQRRADLTGAVASVSVNDAPAAQLTSVGQMVQGRAAGVQVVQNNGAPGAGLSVRVRGTSSITANSEPLYVIDGVPAYVGSGENDPYRNPLNAFSPQDIESIEILKDASATAIYGARGGNGVVLITTRRGQRGQNRVTIESSYGISTAAKTIDMLNGQEFAAFANEAWRNAGRTEDEIPYTDAEVSAMGAGTDWQDEVLRTDGTQSHTVTFSGGDERTRYHVSGSYFDQSGIVIGSGFRRYSARVNIDRTMSDRLQVGANLSLSNTRSDFIPSDDGLGSATVMSALWFNPVLPVRAEDGGFIMNSDVTWPAANPVGMVEGVTNQRDISTLVGNVFADLVVTDALRLRSSLAANTNFERYRFFAPRTSPQGQGSNGDGNSSAAESFDIINENIATYTTQAGPGSLDVTGGFTVQTSHEEEIETENSQFANDGTGVYDLGGGTLPTGDTNFEDWGLLSYLGRANYNLYDRYLFTVTGRYDGSSRFGDNTKWGFFPSAAFAWRIVDEPFMGDQSLFSDLKLRLSYGVTGNQEIGVYQSLARVVPDDRSYSFGGETEIGYSPAGSAPNPDLKWETTRQFNVGFDLGWFNNRITATVDAYHSETDDLLLSVALPRTSGFDSQLRNIGSVQNRGLEVSLSTVNVETRIFSWRSTLNWSANRNEVTSLGDVTELFPGGDKGIAGQTGGSVLVLREGLPLGSFFGLRTEGLYQEGDSCPLSDPRPFVDCIPGEYRYIDTNGDGRIDAADRVVLGDGYPDFEGGLMNTFTYGPLELGVFLQGSYGSEVLNGPGINIQQMNTNSNQTKDALDRWTPENTDTDIPRANQQRPREVYDVHVEDGSYLRLQTLSLGYRIPAGMIPGTTAARLYITGENLHTFTGYSGYDPEANSFGGDARYRGIDLGAYPRARTWSFGMNVTF